MKKTTRTTEWNIFDSNGKFRGIVVGTKLEAKKLALLKGYYRAKIKRRKT